MPVTSLFELARQRLIKNIDMLNDVGDIPFSFLEPILRFVSVPDQLEELERNCPQLLGETGDIWLRFIKRDIPNWDQKPYKPSNPKNWSKAYRKLKKDMDQEKQADADALKQQMQALQKDRAQNKTLIVTSKLGYGAGSSKMFSSRGGGYSRSWGEPSGAPAKTGKAALDKLKRGMFDHGRERPKASQIPAHILAQRKTIVRQAPARMVRMAQNEGPRTMVLSSQAAASVAKRTAPISSANRPQISQRPAPQKPTPPTRTSLPAGQQFTAPKLKAPTQEVGTSANPKRRREEYSLFHQSKRRKT